jgi:hypothetical protein
MLSRTVWKPSLEGYSLTVSQTASLLDDLLAVPSDARMVRIQVETASIRMRSDGTSPAAGVGWLLQAGQEYEFQGWDYMKAIKLVRDTSTSGFINVAYSKAE